MRIVRFIDQLLNGITMYRLLLYGLRGLVAVSFALALLGSLSFSVWALLTSLVALIVSCYGTNWVLARVWGVASNTESPILTALILFLILPPATTTFRVAAIFVAGVVAIASKYVLVLRRRNVFNPAAFGAVVAGLAGLLHATWWVGSAVMLPFVLLLGVVVVRKIRRFSLVLSFWAVAAVVASWLDVRHGLGLTESLHTVIVSSPLIFFGAIMLTEPSTMPPRRGQRIAYGALTGLVFASQVHLGTVSATPELTLVLANLAAFFANPSRNLRLRFRGKTELGPELYDFEFAPDHVPLFSAGQYAAWTLPVASGDSRGNRRTFTIASSPTEKMVHVGVKFSKPPSQFKRALQALRPGDIVELSQIAGDFTLPKKPAQKLVFVAGGIGITPFRSILRYVLDSGQQWDIVLLYVAPHPDEFVYGDVLRAAEARGVRVIKVLTRPQPEVHEWQGLRGRLTGAMLAQAVPDYAERTFYVAGPNAMVDVSKTLLRKLGVKRWRIVSDYFPGY